MGVNMCDWLMKLIGRKPKKELHEGEDVERR